MILPDINLLVHASARRPPTITGRVLGVLGPQESLRRMLT